MESPSPLLRPRDVAILHEGRCGSTLLQRMVNQNLRHRWAGEIFERASAKGTDLHGPELVRRTIRRRRTRLRTFGFETKYHTTAHLRPACIGMSIPDYVDLLRELGVAQFIVINRDNTLKRLASADVAIASGSFHRKKGSASNRIAFRTSFLIDGRTMSLADYLTFLVEERRLIESLLPDALHLVYERDFQSDPLVGYRKVRDLVGLEKEQPKVTLSRTNPRGLEDMFENYADVAAALRGTAHEWMLGG